MRVVLWDTRQRGVSKDFAAGFGVGQYRGNGGLRSRVVRRFFRRDRRPAALAFAYLAAIFKRAGHQVAYSCDEPRPLDADLYVFIPSLMTLDLELHAIDALGREQPQAHVLVCGQVASTLPEAFAGRACTVVRGEPEALLDRLSPPCEGGVRGGFDELLQAGGRPIDLGTLDDLDRLPLPDWSLFDYRRFRIAYDFTRFPTGLVQASRGCSFKCNYCPYIIQRKRVAVRSPDRVAEEIAYGARRYGFRSFKFRDPLFGLDRKATERLVERIGRLGVQFSIESRVDLLGTRMLKAMREAGLTAVTFGVETPDAGTLRRYRRAPIRDDRQREFVARCRELGIRTVAGFMIGFPEDTRASIRAVLKYAERLNPTIANFNICTPYPGTEFYADVRAAGGLLADPGRGEERRGNAHIRAFPASPPPRVSASSPGPATAGYDVYTPQLRCRNLTPEQLAELHAKCFERYYFRWGYVRENAVLLWPWLGRLGLGNGSRELCGSRN